VEGAGHVRRLGRRSWARETVVQRFWARKGLEQLDYEVREGEVNVTVWFAWLVAAQRRQQRAAELSGGGGGKTKRKSAPR
jgi:hypothetical protein